jgi:DNA-binding NtrC family response regulator
VRELENLVERLVVLARGPIITEDDVPLPENEDIDTFFASNVQSLITLEEMEKRYVQYVLTKVGGKKDKTAQILGINRRTLYRKEREYGWVTEDGSLNDENGSNNM